jgi:dTDP-4-dehydrorhamnose reductase
MRVFVVGHRGMLGHVVTRYLAQEGLEIISSNLRYTGAENDPLVRVIADSQVDWIINATGKTTRNAADRREIFLVNTQLPLHLRLKLRPSQRMIHASTDGVFSGKTGNYSVSDFPDAQDDYGLSKSIAEVIAESEKCIVLRCSIIGPDQAKGRGLMSWFLQQTTSVEGFTNQLWNGITTLEWAKICFELIEGKLPLTPSILQPASTIVSKFDLLKLISAVYSHPTEVIPKRSSEAINRTLLPNLFRDSLDHQLKELRAWY